jgi:signal transduction histidine kinase
MQVEVAIYYLVSEALANVAKHAGASRASVSIARANGSVRIEVTDDGVGGARVGTGSGLTGLADRIAALEGSLEVRSPSSGGTTVRAEIPCG